MSVFNRRQRKAMEMLQIKGGKRDMKAKCSMCLDPVQKGLKMH